MIVNAWFVKWQRDWASRLIEEQMYLYIGRIPVDYLLYTYVYSMHSWQSVYTYSILMKPDSRRAPGWINFCKPACLVNFHTRAKENPCWQFFLIFYFFPSTYVFFRIKNFSTLFFMSYLPIYLSSKSTATLWIIYVEIKWPVSIRSFGRENRCT